MADRRWVSRDISDPRVLAAMDCVPREAFVPERLRGIAYRDSALPIERGQTISQPYIVALMTQLAQPRSDHRALDVGTGSGYQAAVLSELVREVYSVEIIPSLARAARDRLKRLGYNNIRVICADGYKGLEEHAPYDVIIAAAAPREIPKPLIEQLACGGRLVLPVGVASQKLTVVEKDQGGNVASRSVESVAFVPMTGGAESQ